MVEAHGPGTPVGDPIEYASLANVYGTGGPCALGSVKTNFGHMQAASGALGLIKAILALQHGVVPPNLHFTRLPDDLTQIETKLFVPQATTPWPTNGQHARRAAVSSYGISGTNVHAILEQAPANPCTRMGRRPDPRSPHHWCSRCHRVRLTNCAGPPGGWPTGWRARRRTPWRCRIWPTPWPVGVGTGPCGPP